MATLVLGAVGTLIGGPLGGAIGALAGRQIDRQIIGGKVREGARLKELAITSSSYGLPIARHYGTVRAAGTIVWATPLSEQRDTSGGGKGQPKSTSYSYSVSFAVLLSGRPIDGVGRIWADGNLLRGAAGDLKTGGTLRIHRGQGDQSPDPLLAAALGAECPAHRGCALAVFEDLQLGDFGNRIPALSFEIFAGAGAQLLTCAIADSEAPAASTVELAGLRGYSHEEGSLADVAEAVGQLYPLIVRPGAAGPDIALAASPEAAPPVLPEAAIWDEGDFGRRTGFRAERAARRENGSIALRYYDAARDYLPGLQRAPGGGLSSAAQTLEFPGVFAAGDARRLVGEAQARLRQSGEMLTWRLTAIDPQMMPGTVVRAPGFPGLWRIIAWEWREHGVELQLLRHATIEPGSAPGDAGVGWHPPDRLPQPTLLRVFELPWDGIGSPDQHRIYAALGAATGRWAGAELFVVQDGALIPTGQAGATRAIGGATETALAPSPALLFEPAAALTIALADAEAMLEPASMLALAAGANRLLLGAEVLQFAEPVALGQGRWELRGLLRGRGGTEAEAQQPHLAGASVTLLDGRLLPIDPTPAVLAASQFAALGITDSDAVLAARENAGLSLQPLTPVHPRCEAASDGSMRWRWTRRARGGWIWRDEVEQPLVEQIEAYEVGLGAPEAPTALWRVGVPEIAFAADEIAGLRTAHLGAPLWVRQIGSYGRSPPLLLTTLS